MLWLILTLLLVLALAGCGVSMAVATETETKAGAAVFGGVAVVVWFVVSVFISVNLIGQRQVGIVSNFSGSITGSVSHGTKFVWPWASVSTENIGLRRVDYSLDPNNSAVSKDQQPVYAELSLNFEVEPADVVHLYKTVGPAWESILLDSRVLQDFKEVTSQYTAAEITTKRSLLRLDTKERLATELAPFGVHVVDFFVKNLDYTAGYSAAINAKNVQVQKALQAQAKVAQARAEAEQNVALAQGQAQAIELKGKALRDNPAVLRLEAIDRLNPNATVVICSGGGQDNCPAFMPAATIDPGVAKK